MRRGLAHWLTIAALLVQGVAGAAVPHMMDHHASAADSAAAQEMPCHAEVDAVHAEPSAMPCCGEADDCACAAICGGQAASAGGAALDWSQPSAQPAGLTAPQQRAPPPAALIRPPISLHS